MRIYCAKHALCPLMYDLVINTLQIFVPHYELYTLPMKLMRHTRRSLTIMLTFAL